MNLTQVILPVGIARCPSNRTDPCGLAEKCARALTQQKQWPTVDFSTAPKLNGTCAAYIAAEQCRKAVPEPGPRVHDAIGGIV